MQRRDILKLLTLIHASDDPSAGMLLLRIGPEALATFKLIQSRDPNYANKVAAWVRPRSGEAFFRVERIINGDFEGVTMSAELAAFFADDYVKDIVFEVAAAIENGIMNVPLENGGVGV